MQFCGVFVITFKCFWFFLCLKMHMKAEVTYFENLKKKLGYKRLQLCSWKKYFSKIWKGAQQGYFCRNFKLAYRRKFLIFFNAWKCARKLKCSNCIMSKKIGIQALTNVFLKKKTICKTTFFKFFFKIFFLKSTFASACAPFFHYIIKI